MKKCIVVLVVSFLTLGITACGSLKDSEESGGARAENQMQTSVENEEKSYDQKSDSARSDDKSPDSESAGMMDVGGSKDTSDEEEGIDMVMKIGETPVQVVWENNESIEALRQLVAESPLIIQMSMYGGFEQVGPIGQKLPRDDKQTTTKAGDIVLYSGNQIVVFYGSNSWAYTRLGHISDKNEKELTELLGNGDVTITIGHRE